MRTAFGTVFRERISAFFGGRCYPVLIVALALVGHALALEVITNLLSVLLVSAALLLTESVKPIIPYMMTVVFAISRAHGPGVPYESDYLMTGWRLPVIVISFVILAAAILTYAIRAQLYLRPGKRDLPLLLPLGIFAVALMTNGAFSGEWTVGSLGYGALSALLFLLPFLLLYLGFQTEDKDEITAYFSYNSALVAVLLFIEVALVYLVGGVISDGEIVKENILFGWGIWNSMGVALAMTIPAIFIGVLRSRHALLYFGAASLALVGVILTMSRAAWLVGAVAYVACLILAAVRSRHKSLFGVVLTVGALALILIAIIRHSDIPDLIARLFNDNGRLELYKLGIEEFLSSPVFGTGFFGFELPDDPLYFKGADFIPAFAHQTFVELLSAMGVFGLLSYLAYRASTIVYLVKRPTVNNCLLFATAAVMLAMSLVDNFLFQIWPTLTYSLSLSIMMQSDGREP